MIQFGTGGWRAVIGDGFIKENIQKVGAALARRIKREGSAEKGVCVGYDRRFLSREACIWFAETLAGEGVKVLFVNLSCPTPQIMFAVKFMGLSYGAMEAAGVFSPVVSLNIEFKRPARFDDEVEVQLAIAKYTGVRLEVGYTFFNRTRNELCATAASAHCFVKDGRVVSLQRALPAAHERLLACLREENAL